MKEVISSMKHQVATMKSELGEVEAKKSEYFRLHQEMDGKGNSLKKAIRALEDAVDDLESIEAGNVQDIIEDILQ